MNSENAPKEIAQPFTDLVDMAKWLMVENQQPSVTQELGRLFASIRGGGRRGESSELLSVGAGESPASAIDTNNTSFAARSNTKRTIEKILGSKATSKKPRKSMLHKTTSGKTRSKFAILFRENPVLLDLLFGSCHFSILIFHDCSLKFSKQKMSCFEPFQFQRPLRHVNAVLL